MVSEMEPSNKVGIVGGGLGGLATAVYLARAGRQVSLFEKASDLGGRARSQTAEGYAFNMGAHASYNSGAGAEVLRELGVERLGGSPPFSVVAYKDDALFPISGGLRSVLSTRLLTLKEKAKVIALLGRLNKIDTKPLQSVTWNQWIDREVGSRNLSSLIETLFRLVTYSNDPDIASVAPALDYLKKALDGVLYLDGGWQNLVDQLRAKAENLGVELNTGTAVEAIEQSRGAHSIILTDTNSVNVSEVILAVDPKTAARLTNDRSLSQWANSTRPVRSAVFQIGLSRLPNPDLIYCLGVGEPLYYSAHSAWAKLAPKGASLVELQKYLGTSHPSRPDEDRAELEAFMERLQPGWKQYVIRVRFLPEMVVSTDLVEAARGGLPGRPPVYSRSDENLYFVGDWAGSEGILSDASLANARLVTDMVLQMDRKRRSAEIEVVR